MGEESDICDRDVVPYGEHDDVADGGGDDQQCVYDAAAGCVLGLVFELFRHDQPAGHVAVLIPHTIFVEDGTGACAVPFLVVMVGPPLHIPTFVPATFGDGGYAFSLVLSLMMPGIFGCSPGVYGERR